MFSSLGEKLQETLQRLKKKGKLSEQDVKEALRSVRLALLEADVNYKVVKDFTAKINERAIGQEVMKSLTPGQQVVKIVHEELTNLLGEKLSKLTPPQGQVVPVMMVGLQGSGKTTSCAKLAQHLKKNGYQTMLVAADIYRPAAIDQLVTLGEKIDVPVFTRGSNVNPEKICSDALKEGKEKGYQYLVIDTAGRLHINEELMNELNSIKKLVKPEEILLVVDAMTGQDAVNVATGFHEMLSLTGIVLTKLDGDARGGAALSVRSVTGCPVKFIGTGEKMGAFEPFYPERLSSRILGMGDVLSLIEKAEASVDMEKSKELEKKIREQKLTLEDFLDQLAQIKKMGPLDQIMEMLPGAGPAKQLKNLTLDEKELGKVEAIVQSMTKEERVKPEIINSSRRKRIAQGSGTKVQDVNRLLKQFEQMRKMLKQMGGLSQKKSKKHNKGFLPF